MARDLTTSQVDRQNILNNENAVAEIRNQTGLQGIIFEGRLCFTKAMVASFFEVEVRTIERYVSENLEEISANGYEIIKGKRLKDFLNCVLNQDVPDINVGNISNRSVTYKLKLNGGDIKAVQGDSGHSQINMVTDVYSHIIDDDRRKNAELFEEAFYEKKDLDPSMHAHAAGKTVELPTDVDAELLAKVLSNPEMAALLSTLAKSLEKK